ncbi:MAG: cytochrome c [Rhodocyclaceae bacterium]|nr:cytochrome c [Rhodocyclaceae bacterium]
MSAPTASSVSPCIPVLVGCPGRSPAARVRRGSTATATRRKVKTTAGPRARSRPWHRCRAAGRPAACCTCSACLERPLPFARHALEKIMKSTTAFVLVAAAAVLAGAAIPLDRGAFAATGVGGGSGLGPVTGAAAEGRKLWLKLNCSGCHGAHDEGGMGPSIHHEADDVAEAVLQGKGEGMPAYSGRVTRAQLAYLSAYLRSIDTAGEPRFTHWWEATPSR